MHWFLYRTDRPAGFPAGLLLRKFGPKRLLFATDFPASRSLRPEEIYTVYCGILDQMDFTPEEAAGIAYKNAVGLLG